MTELVLIRTDGGLWRPKANGYTNDVRDAGRFTREQGEAYIRDLGPEKMARLLPAPPADEEWTPISEAPRNGPDFLHDIAFGKPSH